MKHICIYTDIGGHHGIWHATRMRALALELAALGAQVSFTTSTPSLAEFVATFSLQESWCPNECFRRMDVYIHDSDEPCLCDGRWEARGIQCMIIDTPIDYSALHISLGLCPLPPDAWNVILDLVRNR